MTELQRVGVVGAGTMGASIAQVVASAGLPTRVYDVDDAALQRGLGSIRTSLERIVKRGRLTADEAEAIVGRLAFTTDLADFADVDFVIEAAPERLDLKRQIFAQLDQICPPRVVLASNTSSLSITELAAATERPERVVGMHFFNPPVVLPLVEVARAAQSSAASAELTTELARRIGKTPVQVADTPGFIVNRVARPYYLEGLRILGEGLADHRTIDRVMRLAGFKMGPFELMDLIGIDVNYSVSQSVYEQSFLDPRYRPHPIQRQMVRANRFGRKSGRGFYEYGEAGAVAPPTPPTPPAPTGPVWIGGDGELASALAELCRGAGLALTDDPAAAGTAIVAGEGMLEVRRLGLRNALERTSANAQVAAYCAPWTLTEIASTLRQTERIAAFACAGDPRGTSLVEVAGGLNSSEAAVRAAEGLFQALGKEPVRVGDGPGMVFLRVVGMLANEAAAALDDGVATAADIDTAMKLGVAYPHGPLEWADRLGLDLVLQTIRTLQQDYGDDRYRPAIRLRRLVQAGRLGRPAGRGFFDAS